MDGGLFTSKELCHQNVQWALDIYLDADERIDEKTRSAIRSMTSSGSGVSFQADGARSSQSYGAHLRIVDHVGKWDASPEGKPFFDSPQVRLFKKDERIFFSGVCKRVSPTRYIDPIFGEPS